MTCPSLLRRSAAAEALGDPSDQSAQPAHAWADAVLERLRRDDTLAQFARFVLVGMGTNLVYAVLFIAAHARGALPAHVFATIVSTVVANEMHRRLTFHAGQRVTWFTAQWEAGGITLVGLLATSTALGWLDAAEHAVPALLQIGLVVTVTGLVGLLRFAALRWIFRSGAPARPAAYRS